MKWLDNWRADREVTKAKLREEKKLNAILVAGLDELQETPLTPKKGSEKLLLKTEIKYDSFKATIKHTPTKEGSEPFVTKGDLIFTNKAIITTTSKGKKLRYPYTSLDDTIFFEPNKSVTKLGTFYISSETTTLKLDMSLAQFKKLTIINNFTGGWLHIVHKN